jgi:hypothetical protein
MEITETIENKLNLKKLGENDIIDKKISDAMAKTY